MGNRFYATLLLTGLVFASCSNEKRTYNGGTSEEEGSLPVINLSDNVEEVKLLNLSDAAERVEIVKLETTDKALIRDIDHTQVTENDIWMQNGIENVFRFSRDGKFLNMVGKRGQGPAEYPQIGQWLIDDKRKEVYISSSDLGIKVYDFEGNFLRQEMSIGMRHLHTMAYYELLRFHDTWLMGQNLPADKFGEHLWSFGVFDKDFNVISRFKNPAHIGHEDLYEERSSTNPYDVINLIAENPWNVYDTFGDELTIKFPDTDTIYVYNESTMTPMPQYAIHVDENTGPYILTHEMYVERRAFDYYKLVNYLPSKDYIYLLASKGEQILTYAYDKKKHTVRLQKREGEIYEQESAGIMRMFGHNWFMYTNRYFLLDNDINGGNFRPRYRSEGRYWIYPLQPSTEDYDKYVADLRKSPDAPKKQELLNVIDNTDDEDNPILLIAVLK